MSKTRLYDGESAAAERRANARAYDIKYSGDFLRVNGVRSTPEDLRQAAIDISEGRAIPDSYSDRFAGLALKKLQATYDLRNRGITEYGLSRVVNAQGYKQLRVVKADIVRIQSELEGRRAR